MWVRARHAGIAVASSVFATLGKCRSLARQKKMAQGHENAGNDLKAQTIRHRLSKGLDAPITQADRKAAAKAKRIELEAKRAARAKGAAKTSLREQAAAHRAAKGLTPEDRMALANWKRRDLDQRRVERIRRLPPDVGAKVMADKARRDSADQVAREKANARWADASMKSIDAKARDRAAVKQIDKALARHDLTDAERRVMERQRAEHAAKAGLPTRSEPKRPALPDSSKINIRALSRYYADRAGALNAERQRRFDEGVARVAKQVRESPNPEAPGGKAPVNRVAAIMARSKAAAAKGAAVKAKAGKLPYERMADEMERMSHHTPAMGPERVRIADLRAKFPGMSKEEFERNLRRVEATGRASMYKLDNPQEVTDRDRANALKTPLGDERHIFYAGGRASGRSSVKERREIHAEALAEERAKGGAKQTAKARAKSKAKKR